MRQLLIRRGQVTVEQVPAPLIEPDHILVEVAYSLISAGTEISGVQSSGKSLIQRALDQPDKVWQVIEHLRSQGIQKTAAKVRGKLEAGSPTGYSCSGIVIQVGLGVTDIQPGDRVACAGSGIANHAEIVLVPRNLLVKVPHNCELKDAASVTLGAIAMQGVRRADPRLGEIIAVVGLGLLGQLTVQLLKAAGCRVVGLDLERRRVGLASQSGADHAFVPSELDVQTEIRHLTGGHGVDAVIITAASSSDAIVQQAMEIARKKGRVVVVGAVGLGLQRSPFYEKELDFLISCSYGPGRYDASYEEKGLDYPYAFVRWTENRNMSEYLRLIGEGKLRLASIFEKEYDLAQATQAYEELQNAVEKPLGVLLRYPLNGVEVQAAKLSTRITLHTKLTQDKINIAIIGAGDFAKGVHLPNLQKLDKLYHIRAIVSSTGSNAKATAAQFGTDYASSNYADVLNDPDVDAVLISTRHHLHAQQAIDAANAGKAIFLEKPMALNQTELGNLVTVLNATNVPFMVGFNRRFSPAAKRIKAGIQNRQSPLMLSYRVNAGYLPPGHWTQGPEGGGRIIGEACHMLDLFQFLVSSAEPVEVNTSFVRSNAEHISAADNVAITVSYEDGSVGTLLYTALGSSGLGKEYVEVFYENRTFVLDDYKTLHTYGLANQNWHSSLADKGHVAELEAFARYVRNESEAPIPLTELIDTTTLTFHVTAHIA